MATEQWNMVSFERGTVAIVANENSLIRVCFERSPDDALIVVGSLYPEATQSSAPLLNESLKQLTEYFLGQRRLFTLPLSNSSLSPFAVTVQRSLLKVPYGEIVTYSELAINAGSPKAARAVGSVMAKNPFPLIVPCHRVVKADGSFGQYSAAHGSTTKAWLIDFERSLVGN
jgi:methylated-DNA-[protein]-cysteine S-methyltransferase